MIHWGDLRWMLPPLCICLVLTGIHGYLGLHVLARKVIFVDLALAQIAALGTTYAILLHYDPERSGDRTVVYLFSLGFTVLGAAIFALTRMRHEKVPQEAFIGIVYAMASALAILLISKSAGESEHIKEMLVGNVLLVTWPTVAKTAILYAVVGGFHYVFRRPFLEISADPEAAAARGRRVRLWDFAFYASFGLVITSSVSIAGVLLVFSFLVVPAVVAFMFQESLGARILAAWAVGTVCSACGMLMSYYGDLPTGPSVVACFASILVLSAMVYYVRVSPQRLRALARAAGGTLLVGAAFWLSFQIRKPPGEHAHESGFEALAAALQSSEENTQIEAIHHLAEYHDPHAVELLVEALRASPSDRVIEHIVQVLGGYGEIARSAVPALEELARRDLDPFLDFELASALMLLRSPSGFAVVAHLLAGEPSPLVEQRAAELLRSMAGQDFGIAAGTTAEERRAARERYGAWLAGKGQRLRWRADLERFE